MCGISILIDKKKQCSIHHIQAMNTCLKHRGPDDEWHTQLCFPDFNLFLGNTQLKIRDLSTPLDQLIYSPNKKYIILLNGEIYYDAELKKELKLSNSSFPPSDIALIGALAEEKGIAALHKLNGIYSLAIIETSNGNIHLLRDSSGARPFYYFDNDTYFVATSEIDAFWSTGLIPRQLNLMAIEDYLRFKYVMRPHTFFEQVFELEPGTTMYLERGENKKQWHNKEPDTHLENSNDLNAATEQFKELFLNVLNDQTKGESNFGVYLSGGVDSSLMVAGLAQLTNKPVRTFSIKIEDPDFEDGFYADKIAQRFACQHESVSLNQDVLQDIDLIAGLLDQPIADWALLPTYLLSARASTNVKYVLSGAGADELFGGYRRHQAYNFYLKNIHKRSWLLPPLKVLHRSIDKTTKVIPQTWDRLLRSMDNDKTQTYLNFVSTQFPKGSMTPREVANKITSFKDALDFDRNNYLINDILMLSDRMTMHNSLELRVPYLDKRIVNFGKHLDRTILEHKEPKIVLKKLLNALNCEDVSARKKMGFGIPFRQWLLKNSDLFCKFRTQSVDTLSTLVNPDTINHVFSVYKSGKVDYSQEIWSLVLLAKWLDKKF